MKGQPNGDYNLEAKSLTGAAFYKYNSLNLNEKKRTVLVQTDKSIYKPADKVQFRVLVLDSDMKPGSDANVTVFISDGAKNRVKQFDNVKMTKGVFQSELQLSDLPVMGSWKIHVKVNKGKETTKDFEVAEYTLPKFEVSIDANPDANYKDGKIRATVRAKYTFGKIAKGNATVTAEVLNRYRWYGNNPDSKKVSKTVEVDGKKPVEFDIEKELGLTDKNSEREIKIFATFKEELTEKEQNATASVKIHITPHTIEMKKSSEKFKPGLPFFVDAIVRYHDKKAPVSDKHNPLKFTTKFYYDMIRNCTRNRHISSWNYKKPPQEYLTENYTCREEKNYEETKEVFLENGISELKIDVPANTTRIDVVAKYLETEGSSSYIRRAETASNEFIQIKTATENPILSQKVKIDVLATSPLKQITYQVIGKGDIVLSETVAVDDKRNFQIEFTPTLAMVPKAKVVVFYITDDGEIISDFTKIEFANELRNFINIELSNNQTKPGEELDIVVKSNPGSYVGLLGVDQSVLLLKKGNDIEESTVFEELDKYSEATKYNYEYYESYDDRYRDFDASDFVVITNTKKQHCKIFFKKLNRFLRIFTKRPIV